MIADVYLDHATYADLPHKFEAGTPAIAETIALGAAVDYLSSIGMDKIAAYEHELTAYLYQQIQTIPEIKLYGPLLRPMAAVVPPWLRLPLTGFMPRIWPRC